MTKLLSLARDLRVANRASAPVVVAEGVRTVETLLEPRFAFVESSWLRRSPSPPGEGRCASVSTAPGAVLELDAADFATAADTESPQGVLAVAEQPTTTLDGLGARLAPRPDELRLLVLDGVQDPGNVGTLLRAAAGLGATAALALPGTVDLWSAKVVRSAMGAHFRLPSLGCTWDGLATFLAELGTVLWAADGTGTPCSRRHRGTAPPPRSSWGTKERDSRRRRAPGRGGWWRCRARISWNRSTSPSPGRSFSTSSARRSCARATAPRAGAAGAVARAVARRVASRPAA
jgi:TrmH family RNA methyltransferase